MILRLFVRPIEHRPEKATINGTLIQHDRIFLVVARIARNGDDGVTTGCQLFKPEIFHGTRRYKRLLRIVEQVSQSVHSHLVVRSINSHGLLSHSRLIGVSGGLIVVGKGDNWSTNAQNHWRMNFTVRKSGHFCTLWPQILDWHSNHGAFFFITIDKFNETLLATLFEIPSWSDNTPCLFCFLQQLLNVILPNFKLILFDNVKRSLNTTCVSAKFDFSFGKVSHDRNFSLNSGFSPQSLKIFEKFVSVGSQTNPVSIHEHLGHFRVIQIVRRQLFKLFHAPILQLVNNVATVGTDRNQSHEGQVFNQTASLSLGSLSRTYHTPVRVV